MIFDLISIGSTTKDIFLLTNRGKIFRTPKDKLAPEWLGFELGEKNCVNSIVESDGGVATSLSVGTRKLGLKSASLGSSDIPVSVIIVDENSGERVIFYQKKSGTIKLSLLNKMKTKWLSVSSLTGNWSKEAGEILAFIKKGKVKLILAPSTSMIRDGHKNLKRFLRNAEIILLNRNEAIEIASNEKHKDFSTKGLIKFLHNLGPKIVALTDGRKGAFASDGKQIVFSPIRKVKTVDMTGAGDAFAGGFLGFYIKGKTLENSLKAGIINSASVVRFPGITKGLLAKKEINKYIK